MLRFWATVLLGSHLLEIHGVGQKIGNQIFQTRQIQHLHVKFLNECQMGLLSG
jgi:hypothetical protein